ncbi:MAG: hypothetical protein HZB85_00450 [Deltaproteobacteria bacterium]|nr:hypothetical protein [Deltaproteobacteria bacterium]
MSYKRLVIFALIGIAFAAGYFLIAPSVRPPASHPVLLPRYVAAEGRVEAMPGGQIEVGIDLRSARTASMRVKEGDDGKRGRRR